MKKFQCATKTGGILPFKGILVAQPYGGNFLQFEKTLKSTFFEILFEQNGWYNDSSDENIKITFTRVYETRNIQDFSGHI